MKKNIHYNMNINFCIREMFIPLSMVITEYLVTKYEFELHDFSDLDSLPKLCQ